LKPVVWSFFSGAMGLDLGLEAAGLAPSLAVEMEPKFCKTIAENRPEISIIQSDVGHLSAHQLFEVSGCDSVDVMVGGPPCQSFSTGGNRAALSDTRGNAIFEYLRLVREVRPARFVLENVANIVTAAIRHRPIADRPGKSWNLSSYSEAGLDLFPGPFGLKSLDADELSGSAVRYLLDTVLADLGYNVRFAILDAADYGAPQRRLRFVMIGDRDSNPPEIIKPTHGTVGSPFSTVRDAIWDVRDCPGPGSKYSEETRAVFDIVPEGGNWRDLPIDVAKKAMGERSLNAGGGKTGFFRRLSWEGQAPTVTGKSNRKGSAMCHPSDSRPLSVLECARLQGFPDEWKICGSVADQYLQIGNAVPIALGRAIGESLKKPSGSPADVDEMLLSARETLRASARNKRPRRAS